MPTVNFHSDPSKIPNLKRDYEFVLRCEDDARQQARLARVCEWHIFEATDTENLNAIADGADKAASSAVENASLAMERAREMTRILGPTTENQLREQALRATAETVRAAADAMESSRVVGERWMKKAPDPGLPAGGF